MNEVTSQLPQGRAQLVQVLAAASDVIHVDDVVSALGLARSAAAQRLARWTTQGWLRRVGHGAYVAAAVDMMGSEHVLDDPWVLVPALYSPCYVGGRTAAEHWDLTEQIFKDVFVLTAQAIREKQSLRHGVTFSLKHIAERKLFGTKTVWRHQSRVPVSDVHRTVIDMLDDPAIGGGIQHVADCLANYLRRDDRDEGKIIAYADRLGNGAVFKRLGFLAEGLPRTAPLIEACQAHMTSGYAKLDAAQESPAVSTRWRLHVPARWEGGLR